MIDPLANLAATLALTLGVAWASGLNLYAVILALGLIGHYQLWPLPADLAILAHPAVLLASGLMYLVEFVVDKIPGLDSLWDTLHTFIRIPAGAALAAAAIGEVPPEYTLVAAILGGTLAAGAHAAKAGSRLLLQGSPEPVSNWVASLSEDVAVFGGLLLALTHPWVFLVLLALFLLLLVWLLPWIWQGVRAMLRTLGRWFGRQERESR
ncbi:MAG: DUF4126 domain-containing protein [Trichloromonadaceae bacterium]